MTKKTHEIIPVGVEQTSLFEEGELREMHPIVNPDHVKNWLEELTVMDQSRITHQRNLRPFYMWLIERKIFYPTKRNIEEYRDDLLRHLSATTVRNYVVTAKSFLRYLEKEGIYPDVSRGVKLPVIESGHRKEVLTLGQIQRILDSFDESTLLGARDKAIFALMVCTGIRVNAVRMADFGDLKNKAEVRVLFYLQKGYSDKGGFCVPVVGELDRILENYLSLRYQGSERKSEDPLFVSVSNQNGGSRMSARSISGMVKRKFREIGLDDNRYSAHSLRATWATLNTLLGGTAVQTKAVLGHSSIETTMIYVHEAQEMVNPSVERVTNRIFGKD